MEHDQWKEAFKLAEEKDKRAVKRAMLLEELLVKDYALRTGMEISDAEKQLRDQHKIFRVPYLDSHGNKFFGILSGTEGLSLLNALTNEAACFALAEGAFRVIIPNLTSMDPLVWETWKGSNNYFAALQQEVSSQNDTFTLERATYREDPFKRITLQLGYKPRGTRAQKIADDFQPGADTDRFPLYKK